MMMKWRINKMKNIHNLRGLGFKIWMENVDIHETIHQCLNQPFGFAQKACKKQMVHRKTKHSNFNLDTKEESRILKCIDQ
jgi:hypothetical protein